MGWSMTISMEETEETHSQRVGTPNLRQPTPEDGFLLNRLVAVSPPLDTNSVYCNLLQCSHFADTAVAADLDGKLVGFISGYIPPAKPDTLFVWQVVIAETMRGQGLAKQMMQHLLLRLASRSLRFIETTITPDNDASWGLFRSLARDLNAELVSDVFFRREQHFGGQHDDEHLLQIGPINSLISR
jgi:L-2,4-diaminobutyric acid acetyltransferase